jgi:esterase/lipase superfamily enzyme
MPGTELFASVKSLLGTRRKLAALCVVLQERTFTRSDYKLLDGLLQRFEAIARLRRITVYKIGPKRRIAIVRLATGPQFYLERFFLADQYVAEVLSDLLRKALNIAANGATGTAIVEFATPETREEIARIELSSAREMLPTFALSMVMPERLLLEERLVRSPDFNIDNFIGLLAGGVATKFDQSVLLRHLRGRSEWLSEEAAQELAYEAVSKAATPKLKALKKVAVPKVKHARKVVVKQVAKGVKVAKSVTKDALNSGGEATKRAATRLAADKPEQPRLVDIFYATDRTRTGSEEFLDFYGYGQAEELALGVCRVSIPPRHTIGRVEEPTKWKLEFRPNPAKHVVITEIEELSTSGYYDHMREAIDSDARRQAFIFVHGYNVTFSDAAKRTAQIHADLNFAGAPILYSWPSRGTFMGYWYDGERVKATRKRFADFVLDVWNRTGANEIHVVAHSMGNRVVAAALESIGLDAAVHPKPPFNQIVLAAPDLDVDDFSISVSRMQGLGKRLTLYASSRDKAILASKLFLFKLRRAGEGGRNLVVLKGLDSIDASLVDTDFLAHSYIADSGRLLGDLHALVNANSPPPRFGIAARGGGGWMFLKQA